MTLVVSYRCEECFVLAALLSADVYLTAGCQMLISHVTTNHTFHLDQIGALVWIVLLFIHEVLCVSI